MNLCINCLHFVRSAHTNQDLYGKCSRLALPPTTSLVTGESLPAKLVYCSIERGSSSADSCGPDGRFWQAAS